MPELKTPTQALAAALLLAVTAPHDTIADRLERQADAIAAGMPAADVDRVKEVVGIALAMLLYEAKR